MTKSAIIAERRRLKKEAEELVEINMCSGNAIDLLRLCLSQIEVPIEYLNLQGSQTEAEIKEGVEKALKQAKKINLSIKQRGKKISERLETLKNM